MLDDKTANALMDAVEAGFEEQVSQTADLVRFPSTRGAEAPAQDYMARQMRERGLDVDRFKVDINEIRHWPGFSPVHVNYDNAWNVVGSRRVENPKGRSLILNGHVDVVPTGPLDMWSTPPFEPRIENGWMYGRGAGDMKAGLIACLAAMDAVERAGYGLTADVIVQSVIEEECTGNGALACLARGYKADAALIPEPQNQTMIRAQIGVIWFQVNVRGIPVHVADAGEGANAIEAAYTVMQALHELEHEWNSRKDQYPPYETVDHPINLNVGRIEGGDWASSVPAWCTFDVRVAIYPGQDIAEAKREIEEMIRLASRRNAFLQNNPPQIVYNGFEAEGYILKDAEEPVGMLARSHQRVFGEALEEMACTATTDARFFGLYADTPALVYGPTAELIHGFDERVSLESLLSVTKAMTLFLADWCGVEEA